MNTNNNVIDIDKTNEFLDNELKNFQAIATRLKPCSGDVPVLNGIDIFGGVIPYNSVVGGDRSCIPWFKAYFSRFMLEKAVSDFRCFHIIDIKMTDAVHNLGFEPVPFANLNGFITGKHGIIFGIHAPGCLTVPVRVGCHKVPGKRFNWRQFGYIFLNEIPRFF